MNSRPPFHIRDAIYAGLDVCASQGHPEARWVYQVTQSGSRQYGYHCPRCDRFVTVECYADRGAKGVFVSPDFIASLGVEVPSVERHFRELAWRRCQRCKETRLCEDHHWAPQAAFKDADEWPIGPLCQPCHLRYTQTLEAYIQDRIRRAGGRAA